MALVWKRAHTALATAAAVAVVGTGIWVATTGEDPGSPVGPPPVASSSAPAPAPAPSPSARPASDPLTGGKVSGNEVIAAKVENIDLARPQVGLSVADLVFVEEVEGAQTRLVAVYHSRFPSRLGPIRSARSTDVQLLPLFGRPGLVYSGANSRVQAKIERASIELIYRETRDRRRVAPHNVFVNLKSIAGSEKGGKASSIGWTFAATTPQWAKAERNARPRAKVGHDTFSFDIAKGRYTVRWNGKRYVDGDSRAVTKTDNVVVLRVRNHPDGNRDVAGAASVMSDTVGRGKVTVYRDGKQLSGTWERPEVADPLRLRDSRGDDIALKPGQTWVTLSG